MSGLRTPTPGRAGREPARNDPCPCGSGLKYKQCCAIRPRTGGAAPAARVALGPLTEFGRELAVQATVVRTVREAQPQAGTARPGAPPAGPGSRSATLADCLRDARRLRAAGRVADAIPPLEQAARLDPANARIRVELGAALLNVGRLREAADSFARAIQIDPKLAVAHYNLGLALSQQGRITEAIVAHRAAIARAATLADAHLQLGDLLYGRLSTEQAAETFDRAAAVLAGTTKGRLAAARALLIRNRPEEAMTLLRRALALDPKSVDAVRLVAHTLGEAGRFDEAEQLLMQALALDGAGAFDYFELAKLRKVRPEDRPRLQRMAALLQAGGISQYDRMLLHFGLGKAHDDLREFEAAVGHFDAANRIRGTSAPLDRRTLSGLVDRNIELFPRGANGFDGSLGVEDERPVFILGLPRSGTTLVEQILSSHPGVAAGGELGFWTEHGWVAVAPDAKPLTREVVNELAGRYRALLRGISPDALRVTDKNPFNFFYIGLLRVAFPRAFIIHCRRHPVDNCLSMYTTYLGARDTHFMGNREDLVFYHGEYSRLMRHWREVLPPGRFLEIDYEALTGDSEGQTRRLVAFCELDWHDACLQPERNERAVATASVWQARQPVYRSSVERWRNYLPWLGPLGDLLPEAQRSGGHA